MRNPIESRPSSFGQAESRRARRSEAAPRELCKAGPGAIKILFFINGPDEHGLVRASRILADGLMRLDGCSVTVVRSTDAIVRPDDPEAFYAPFHEADVVVIHGSSRTSELWGAPLLRGGAIAAFCAPIRKPVVMYLHDVYGETRLRCLLDAARRCAGNAHDLQLLRLHGSALLREILGRPQSLEPRFISGVDSCVSGFLVSNSVERQRLQRHRPRNEIEVVPNFIEQRASLIDKADAKTRIGASGRLVVTLLGFIHRRKGHDIALSMLQWLPQDTVLVFAGGTVQGQDPFARALQRHIEARDLQERVHITGYLEDDSLDVYLSATDVAVCPFRKVAASASLATWLAAGRPIVATDLPLFRIYKAEFGDGILLARAEDAAEFARLVELAFAGAESHEVRIRAVAQRYSVENTARRMLACLKRFA